MKPKPGSPEYWHWHAEHGWKVYPYIATGYGPCLACDQWKALSQLQICEDCHKLGYRADWGYNVYRVASQESC